MDKERLTESRSDGGAIRKTFSYDHARSVSTRHSHSGLRGYAVQPKPEEKKYDFRDYIIKEVPKVQVHTLVPYQQENNTGDSETRAKLAVIKEIDKTEPGLEKEEVKRLDEYTKPNPALLYNSMMIGKNGVKFRLGRTSDEGATTMASMTNSRVDVRHRDALDLNDGTKNDNETQEKLELSARREKKKDSDLDQDGLDIEDIVHLAQANATELQEQIIEKKIEEYMVSCKALQDMEQATTESQELRPRKILDLDVNSRNKDAENLTQKKKAPLWAMLFTQGSKSKVRYDKVKKISNDDLEDESESKNENAKLGCLHGAFGRLREFGTHIRRRLKLLKNRVLRIY